MRRALMVTIVTAVTAAGLSSCSDRPNDLDTYYDGQGGSPEAQTPGAPSTDAPQPSPAADAAMLDEAVRAAVLTDADVASEGVAPAPPVSLEAELGCLAQLPAAAPHDQRERWNYPTGSILRQRVTAYPRRSAADVLPAVHCAGEEVPLAAPVAEAHAAWCDAASCTAVLGSGNVLSAVQVVAGDRQRAMDAVRRLVPLAAQRLTSP